MFQKLDRLYFQLVLFPSARRLDLVKTSSTRCEYSVCLYTSTVLHTEQDHENNTHHSP